MATRIGAVALAVALLVGCRDATPDAQSSDAMAADTKAGKGTGTVTEVDAAAGSVTIEHGAMPEVGWPAMTMAFQADSALLAGVSAGDTVVFDLTVTDGRGTITALQTK